eukprot:UN29178
MLQERVENLVTQMNHENNEWSNDASNRLSQLQNRLEESKREKFVMDRKLRSAEENAKLTDGDRHDLENEIQRLQNELSELQMRSLCMQENIESRKNVLEAFNSLFQLVDTDDQDIAIDESVIYHSENWLKTLMSSVHDFEACLDQKLKDMQWSHETEISRIQKAQETLVNENEMANNLWGSEKEKLLEKIDKIKDEYRFQSVDMIKLRDASMKVIEKCYAWKMRCHKAI